MPAPSRKENTAAFLAALKTFTTAGLTLDVAWANVCDVGGEGYPFSRDFSEVARKITQWWQEQERLLRC